MSLSPPYSLFLPLCTLTSAGMSQAYIAFPPVFPNASTWALLVLRVNRLLDAIPLPPFFMRPYKEKRIAWYLDDFSPPFLGCFTVGLVSQPASPRPGPLCQGGFLQISPSSDFF